MSQPQDFDYDHLLKAANRLTEAIKPQTESRRDVAKTLVSLSSAELLFTITFASSLIKPNSAASLRYTVGACWLALVVSLSLSLLSLWFSIGLQNYQAFLMTKTKEIDEIVARQPESLNAFLDGVWKKEIAPDDKRSRRSLQAALISYAIALAILLVVGLWQFIL